MADPILDHPLLSDRYFYPWPSRLTDPFPVQGDGFRLECRYRHLSSDFPTIIHFHGNGETVADYVGEFEERITSLRCNLLLSEYRGYGMSSGHPSLAAMLDDVRLVVEASDAPPEQVIFFGRSLGSLYAIHGAALYPQAAGLIIESGIAEPLERILMRVEPWQIGTTSEGLREAVDACFDQRTKIGGFFGQVLIMHALNDDLIPCTQALQLYHWANQPKELLMFERGNHNNILAVNADTYFEAVGRMTENCRPVTRGTS